MKEHRTLSQAYPALVSEWSEKNFPFLPDDEHEDSYSRIWWKCPVCGHEWQAAVRSRAIRGTGCPCCAGKVIKEGVNDLASLRPDIAAEWSDKNLPLTPDQVTQWSSRSVWWKGECGHEWKTTIGNRCKGNSCPICAKEPLIPGVNDLLTTHPDIAAEWSGRNAFLQKISGHPTQNKCCGNVPNAEMSTWHSQQQESADLKDSAHTAGEGQRKGSRRVLRLR